MSHTGNSSGKILVQGFVFFKKQGSLKEKSLLKFQLLKKSAAWELAKTIHFANGTTLILLKTCALFYLMATWAQEQNVINALLQQRGIEKKQFL